MTRCANTAQICSKVVAKALYVYGRDCRVLVFLGLAYSGQAYSGQAPLFSKALKDAVEGILMKEPQIAFFVARNL